MAHRALLLLLLITTQPLSAADKLFPTFSVTASMMQGQFDTEARIDPGDGDVEGTIVSFERDLGLTDNETLERFGLQWQPLARHELAASHFSANRHGFAEIDRQITFRDEVYPVRAAVTTDFNLDFWSAAYTYWPRRTERGGLGITLGAATLAFDTRIMAVSPDDDVTITEEAETDVPVALAGVQGRVAFTNYLHAGGSISTLPQVTIDDYTGSALSADARLEYRPLRWLGVGAAYSYFRLNVDVAQADLRGALVVTIRGPEAYIRLAF